MRTGSSGRQINVGMRNYLIQEIHKLLDVVDMYPQQPLHHRSNSELLQLYGELRIEIETEEYDSLLVGSEIMSDKGYQESTLEKCQEFSKKRNYDRKN